MTSGQTVRHGHGLLCYSNGLIYEGEFYHGMRQGFGILRFNHVELYTGEWREDELAGHGKIRNCAIINKRKNTHNGNENSTSCKTNTSGMFNKWISYCGGFRKNRFEGMGTLYLQGGEKFAGGFRNGAP